MEDDPEELEDEESPDEEVQAIMDDHDVDEEIAERAVELRDELGIDDEDAVQLAEEGL